MPSNLGGRREVAAGPVPLAALAAWAESERSEDFRAAAARTLPVRPTAGGTPFPAPIPGVREYPAVPGVLCAPPAPSAGRPDPPDEVGDAPGVPWRRTAPFAARARAWLSGFRPSVPGR